MQSTNEHVRIRHEVNSANDKLARGGNIKSEYLNLDEKVVMGPARTNVPITLMESNHPVITISREGKLHILV